MVESGVSEKGESVGLDLESRELETLESGENARTAEGGSSLLGVSGLSRNRSWETDVDGNATGKAIGWDLF